MVQDGVDGKSGQGMDIQFARNVLAVCHNRMHRNVQAFCNFFVRIAFGYFCQYLLLPFAQFVIGSCPGYARGVLPPVRTFVAALAGFSLFPLRNQRDKQMVFHIVVRSQVLGTGEYNKSTLFSSWGLLVG